MSRDGRSAGRGSLPSSGEVAHALRPDLFRMYRSGRHLAAVAGAESLGFAVAGDRDLAVEHEHLRVEIMRMRVVDSVGRHLALPDIVVTLLAQPRFETRFVHVPLPYFADRPSTPLSVLTALLGASFSLRFGGGEVIVEPGDRRVDVARRRFSRTRQPAVVRRGSARPAA